MAGAGRFVQDFLIMLFGLLVFGAIVAFVFSFVATYNGLVAAAEKATRAWNELDALLRQRHDEIPKLVEICEPHMQKERTLSSGCSKRARRSSPRVRRAMPTI